MVDKPPAEETKPGAEPQPPAAGPTAPPRRAPGHRATDARDTVAEMALRAQEISQEAGSKIAQAMKDVINAAAGIAEFAVESARDIVQYMVRRGQMTQEEADKIIREAEEAAKRKPAAKPVAPPPALSVAPAAKKPAPKPAKPVAAKPAAAKPAAAKPPAKAAKPAVKKAVAKKPAAKPAHRAKSSSKVSAAKKRK